jgi:hypothetical protein
MSFENQSFKKKAALYKQAIQFQSIASSVFVQKVPAKYLKRLLKSEEGDPVVNALSEVDSIFHECISKDVDIGSSLQAIVVENEESNAHGVAFLAWHLSWDQTRRQMDEPKLVGLITVSDFVPTPNYSTDRDTVSQGDYAILKPYFGGRWSYIDALCSTMSGVGRLLIMHAYLYAIQQKKTGLIALSYSRRRNAIPESKGIFLKLNFETVIANANFKTKMYGSWFAKKCSEIDLAGMASEAVKVCTRPGLTNKTQESLLWRC